MKLHQAPQSHQAALRQNAIIIQVAKRPSISGHFFQAVNARLIQNCESGSTDGGLTCSADSSTKKLVRLEILGGERHSFQRSLSVLPNFEKSAGKFPRI